MYSRSLALQGGECHTKHRSALLPQSFLKNKVVLTGFYMMLASNLTISAMAFLVIIYLQFSVGLSAALSGLTFGILAIGLIVGSIVTPKLLQALSRRVFGSVIFVSLGLSIISLVVGVDVNSFTWLGYLGLAITGLSCGFMMSFAPVLVTSSLSERDAQQSGGMQATVKNIGSALGIAISGSVLLLSLTGSVKSGLEENELVSVETKELILQQSTIPFLTHDNAALSLQKVNVTQADITHFQPAYGKAKLHSFQAAISSTLVFAFIGLALIARLPRTEPKT
jgi:MFS family permease